MVAILSSSLVCVFVSFVRTYWDSGFLHSSAQHGGKVWGKDVTSREQQILDTRILDERIGAQSNSRLVFILIAMLPRHRESL